MIDNLEYNTEREHLIIPEYGRHMQKMINHAKTLETKEERNKVAKAIIAVMGNMQPHLRDVPDFQHKLWDQLFIMSNFELDVDSPYEIPSKGGDKNYLLGTSIRDSQGAFHEKKLKNTKVNLAHEKRKQRKIDPLLKTVAQTGVLYS